MAEYFKGRTVSQVSQLAVERLKQDYAKGVVKKTGRARKPRTVNAVLIALSGIMTLAVRHKLIRANPCRDVKPLAIEELPVRRLAEEEEKALLEAARLDRPFVEPMIQLALWTGFRQGELIELGKAAVDFDRNRVFVFNPKWPKDSRKTEGNPMSAKVRVLLLRLCREATGGYLFTDGGRKLTRFQVDWAFRRVCERASVAGFRFHDLRHEYGSRLGDADVNLKKIARLMGHSKTKQTERYVHPDDSGLLAASEVATRGRTRIVPQGLRQVG